MISYRVELEAILSLLDTDCLDLRDFEELRNRVYTSTTLTADEQRIFDALLNHLGLILEDMGK